MSEGRCIIVIPARMASTRLPRKPLVEIGGKPMIAQVVTRALEADIGRVVVACDDDLVVNEAERAGAEAVLTNPEMPSGTDRIYSAMKTADPDGRYDLAINLQGDMPSIDPAMLRDLRDLMIEDRGYGMATLAAPIHQPEEVDNPNIVKMAFEPAKDPSIGRGLWFSRLPIPHGATTLYHHIGVYAYRRGALTRFVTAAPSHLELTERLEQLRALNLGITIGARIVSHAPLGVDTADQIDIAAQQIANLKK